MEPARTNRSPRPAATAGARIGVWVGCYGWLLGFLLAAPDFVPELWPRLLLAAVCTGAIAWGADRLAVRGAPLAVFAPGVVAMVGALLLFYALVMLPAVRALPELVLRLERLGSVVEVPWWLGAALLAGGLAAAVLGYRRALARRA